MKWIRTAALAGCTLIIFASLVLAATLIDLNTASQKELESLKGVGAVTASKIIAARPYHSVDELSRAGLSARQIAALRPLVTVGAAAAAAPAAAKPSARRVQAAASAAATGPLDLNSASEKELEALKGVGPATAKKIIAGRPYRSVADLSKAGLSAKQISEVTPFVMVHVATPPPAVASTVPASHPSSAKPAAPSGPIDLNTGSEKDLESLKGVGPATAKKIIAARPFASIDDLARAGVSARVIAEIRPLVVVSGTRAATQPAPPRPAPVTAPTAATPAAPVAAATQPAAAHKPKLAPGQVVNINTAPKELLEELPGIGPVKAQAIINGRPFATIEDVMKVKGIKQGEFAKIRNLITVN